MSSWIPSCIKSVLPSSRPIPPIYIFLTFIYINLLNFVDRGIIPGSTVEFDDFIKETTDTSSPNTLLGFLQSSFIVGFVIGSLIFGHYVHYYGKFVLIRVGIGIWIVAVFLSGVAGFCGSYYFLLFARMLSGFSEASIQCTMPPWIQANAPIDKRGLWLSIFYTVFPVGTAIGYTYSSMMSSSVGWEWAFFGEVIVMLPVYFFLFVIPTDHVNHEENGPPQQQPADEEVLSPVQAGLDSTVARSPSITSSSSTSTSRKAKKVPPTMWEELQILCSIEFYNYIILGNAAQTAVLIGVSTFGSAFFMSLGFYDTESEASTMFGVLISLAGIIGVPLGGFAIDWMCTRKGLVIPNQNQTTSDDTSTKSEVGGGRIEVTSNANPSTNINGTDTHSTDRHHSNNIIEQEYQDQQALLQLTSDPIHHRKETIQLLDIISFQLFWSGVLGSLLLCILYCVDNKGLYLFLIVIGCILIFFTFTGIFMAVMSSIPEENRSFGMAFCAIIGHAIGDVPSPIFVGWLKDQLAPDCIGGDDDDGNVASSDACRDDNHGLRLCFLLICLWLVWTVIFFGIAWYRNLMKLRRMLSEEKTSLLRGGVAEEDVRK